MFTLNLQSADQSSCKPSSIDLQINLHANHHQSNILNFILHQSDSEIQTKHRRTILTKNLQSKMQINHHANHPQSNILNFILPQSDIEIHSRHKILHQSNIENRIKHSKISLTKNLQSKPQINLNMDHHQSNILNFILHQSDIEIHSSIE